MRLVRAGARVRRGDMMRRSGLPLVSALLILLATGCHVPGTSSGQAAGSQQITVADVPDFANAPLQVAAKDGLFAENGVNVTVRTYQTLQQAYAAVASGQAEVISGDYAGLLYMQAHAADDQLRLIADGYDATPGLMEVLTLPGSAITAPQDLEGQAVGTPPTELAPYSSDAPYNSETLATEAVLQSDGVSPPSVQWKVMAPSSMISALRDHTVSAIVTTQPYILQAETERSYRQPAAIGVLRLGRLRSRPCGRPGRLPVRAQRGDGRYGPARHRADSSADAAGDILPGSRPRHDRAVPDISECRAGPAGG